MVTALDQVQDRIRGLEAGADDFLTKPVNDLQLMTRIKSLARLKNLTDELRLRAATSRDIGLETLLRSHAASEDGSLAHVLLIDNRPSSAERIARSLRAECDLDVVADPQTGFFKAAEGNFDCVMISTGFADYDPLRICSQLRSLDRTRFLPVMLIADQGEDDRIARGLDLGVNDYVMRPVDALELVARLRTQVRRKRYNDRLRARVSETIEMAVTDGLTGLHNRRYLDAHTKILFDRAAARNRPMSIMMTDIDRFKVINDTYGHGCGDHVLREFARRLRRNLRGIDLACRYGGEEFVIVMPDTDARVASLVAERVRGAIANAPFDCGDTDRLQVTVSVGVATTHEADRSVEDLVKRADVALYEAKNAGRNRVVSNAA
jgi:two-component system cell cycle response regulator